MDNKRSFIETDSFPVELVSQASAKEKQGGGRPAYWEMVFWWTRKPLSSTRAVIAGCLLPEGTDPVKFARSLALEEKVPNRHNPSIPSEWLPYFRNKTLLDPFAGFGSIPLEGLRLGVSAIAVELLPTAYVFLKAILHYPSKYGESLVGEVERWGKWVAEQLWKDPSIEEIYDRDVDVYICSWEVKCPHCGNWSPLVGSYWLARVKSSKGGYQKLAWFEVKKNQIGQLSVSVTDLSKTIGELGKASLSENKIHVRGRIYTVPKSNINPRSEQAQCLSCGSVIRYIDPETGKQYLEKKNLPPEIARRLEWFVKYALRLYNEGNSSFGKPTVLAKVTNSGGETRFIAGTEHDQDKLSAAETLLQTLLHVHDPDVPTEEISPYSVRYLFPLVYGMSQWYRLFNPRQLLMQIKLTKIIREAGKMIEQEKISQGLSPNEARQLAQAITTYLSIAFSSVAIFNNISAQWYAGGWQPVTRAFAMRGLSMQWNYPDSNPFYKGTGSWVNAMGNVVHALKYLTESLSSKETLFERGKSNATERVLVNLDDATTLSTINRDSPINLIVTDPPYYDDVPYTELSDFYYVWLKRCLSDVAGGGLVPRYLPEAFFRMISGQQAERITQWEDLASREVSLNPGRLGEKTSFSDAEKHFQSLLDASFLASASILSGDGLLVTYYAHTDPDAWKALLRSGWEVSGLRVSNAFPLTTESEQSLVKRGKLSLDTSIVVVWRRGAAGSIKTSQLYAQMIESSAKRAQSSIDMKVRGKDLFVGALVAALSEATRYRDVIEMKKLDISELMDKYVYRAALSGLVLAISHKANVEEGIRSSEGMLYLVTKFLFSGSVKKIVTSDDARVFSLGIGVDLSTAVNRLKMFRAGSEEEEGEGSSLARRKTLVLLEPQSKDKTRLKDLLYYRGLDTENLSVRCSVDALHALEYYALAASREEFLQILGNLKTKYPSEVDEAMGLARVIAGSHEDDAEKELCDSLIEKVGRGMIDLRNYARGE